GQTDLLQSSLTRAVMFSALTTATAFGSLWLSSHPGTSSMGKLMALALVTTMAAAVLFQPVLMGPPREPKRFERGIGSGAARPRPGLRMPSPPASTDRHRPGHPSPRSGTSLDWRNTALSRPSPSAPATPPNTHPPPT